MREVLAGAIDLGGQVDRFLDAAGDFLANLSRIEWPYFVAALLLSLALQLCRAHAWSNALRAAYPGDRVDERGVIASFLIGVGMNGILPARGGDAIKIVLAKLSVRDARYPAIVSSFAVLAPFDSGIGLVVLLYAITQGLLPAAPRLPELPAFEISFWAAHPQLLLLGITLLAIAVVVVVAIAARHAEAFWERLKQGVAIFSDLPRYFREVLAWQAAGWICRFASFWLFLDAFGIGGSAENVLLVMSVQAISGALPFTPGGAGAQQALLVITLNGPTYAAVLAYSVGQQLAVTAWSLIVAIAAMVLIFRTRDWRRLLREGRTAQAEAGPG